MRRFLLPPHLLHVLRNQRKVRRSRRRLDVTTLHMRPAHDEEKLEKEAPRRHKKASNHLGMVKLACILLCTIVGIAYPLLILLKVVRVWRSLIMTPLTAGRRCPSYLRPC